MGNGLSEEAVASPEQYSLAQALKHRGQPTPLGATLSPEGANFSVFSASATGFIISLFDHVDALTPRKSIRLGPKINRMGHYWHIFIPELKAEQIYVYRAEGPNDPPNGQRFDASKILIDPYEKGGRSREALQPRGL